jgi:hypothetical protein
MDDVTAFPNGWEEIVEFYTLPTRNDDGTVTQEWKTGNLITIASPFPMTLSWGGVATKITCHKKISDVLLQALNKIKDAGLDTYLSQSYGGCYQDRAIRGDVSNLSLHAFGAALDFRVAQNPLGSVGEPEMAQKIAPVFSAFGFTWGGNFTGRKDPQHFQAASGY